MKKVTSKQIFTGVLVAGVAACMLVYLMVFNKYTEETEALKKSNAALQTEVDANEEYYNKIPDYKAEIAQMTKGINDMTLDYQSDATEEDFLMTAVAMKEATIINYEKINIDEEEPILTVTEDIVKGAKIEGLETQIDFMARKASYANQTDYQGLRKCIEVIYDSPYRVGIDAIAYKKESDSDNFIKGTIDVTYFSLLGMNKEYKYPEMDSYLAGAEDELFGKLIVSDDDDSNKSSED